MDLKGNKIYIISITSIIIATIFSNAVVIFAIISSITEVLQGGSGFSEPFMWSVPRTLIMATGLTACFFAYHNSNFSFQKKLLHIGCISITTIALEIIMPTVSFDIYEADKASHVMFILGIIRSIACFAFLFLTMSLANYFQKRANQSTKLTGWVYLIAGTSGSTIASAINYPIYIITGAISGLLFGFWIYLGFALIAWLGAVSNTENSSKESEISPE